MRDLLPAQAKFQSRVGRDLMAAFDLFGYERVWLPTFEFASVLGRARASTGSALRFIEPETGEVVALRSDMTPQIARVVATRFRGAPRPLRLCYQGSVVRRRKERARTESQVVQAGAELIGLAGSDGDFEVMELLCSALSAAKLDDFVLDIGHSGIAQALTSDVAPELRLELREALAAKDQGELGRLSAAAGLRGKALDALLSLVELHGAESIWPAAGRCLSGSAAESQLAELRALYRRAQSSELAPRVLVDLGAIWDFDYYTGPVFQALAHGPGEPLASGGRYDQLHQRFGSPDSAAGFAIDLNHLCWALEQAGRSGDARPRVAVAAGVDAALVRALRERALSCTVVLDPRTHAAYWRHEFVLERDPVRVTHLPSNQSTVPQGGEAEQIARQVLDFVAQLGSQPP